MLYYEIRCMLVTSLQMNKDFRYKKKINKDPSIIIN